MQAKLTVDYPLAPPAFTHIAFILQYAIQFDWAGLIQPNKKSNSPRKGKWNNIFLWNRRFSQENFFLEQKQRKKVNPKDSGQSWEKQLLLQPAAARVLSLKWSGTGFCSVWKQRNPIQFIITGKKRVNSCQILCVCLPVIRRTYWNGFREKVTKHNKWCPQALLTLSLLRHWLLEKLAKENRKFAYPEFCATASRLLPVALI